MGNNNLHRRIFELLFYYFVVCEAVNFIASISGPALQNLKTLIAIVRALL